MNADRTIYARYGTRTSMDADQDVSLEGLTATMREVLDLHQGYPQNQNLLVGKQPRPVDKDRPEQFDKLKAFRTELDYTGKVAKGCIHCHQLRDAERLEFRELAKPMPEKLLFPFPKSEVLGILFDKQTRSTLAEVRSGSAAEKAGLQAGDQLVRVQGSNIASEADFQWMTHHLNDLERALFPKSTKIGAFRA